MNYISDPVSLRGATVNSARGERWREFGPIEIAAIAVVLLAGNLIGAALVLAWIWATRRPWSQLGFVRSKHWLRDIALGVVAGVVFKLAMKALILPLLGMPATNGAYASLVGNTAALPPMLAWVVVGGGFGEETIWRGFLFERLRALLGDSRRAMVLTVALTSVVFSAAHFPDQGWAGSVQALMTGLAFGAAYARIGSLWPVMAAHAAFDVTAVLMIYLGREQAFAHLLAR